LKLNKAKNIKLVKNNNLDEYDNKVGNYKKTPLGNVRRKGHMELKMVLVLIIKVV
jgi:hypothetical protein